MFLRWWGKELSALPPPRLAVFFGLIPEIVVLIPDGGDFMAQRLLGGAPLNLGRLSQAGVSDQVARRRAAGAQCVALVPADQGLRRQAPIAVAALSRGFDAVAGEIERQTPFAPDQVYLGYRVDDAIDARGRVMAHLAMVPCSSADAILRNLARSGIVPDRISLAGGAGANPAGDSVHILANPQPAALPRWLPAAAGLLLAVALASPHVRNAAALSQIQAQLPPLRQAALAVAENRRAAGDAQSQMAYLAQMRAQRPPVTAVLNAISAAFPDSAYLAQFELAGLTLALQGVAQSAAELIAPLEALPMAERAEFSAPTLREPAAGVEQFQITLSLHGATPAAHSE